MELLSKTEILLSSNCGKFQTCACKLQNMEWQNFFWIVSIGEALLIAKSIWSLATFTGVNYRAVEGKEAGRHGKEKRLRRNMVRSWLVLSIFHDPFRSFPSFWWKVGDRQIYAHIAALEKKSWVAWLASAHRGQSHNLGKAFFSGLSMLN